MTPARRKTHRQFRAALREHDGLSENRICWANHRLAKRAAYAAWWFIENVTEDDPSRNDIFFEVREIVRSAA